ncbi:ATP-binding cassette domain-containing protein [Thermococcus waiotapuensis]|uniref:DUF4162 domain-containing protein n=1 Tax=Thermococcus waiotapuensis TaxID=90909 RepID=A0AAE4SYP2_9EURY|nr:hypothetical protein [Thermococcus waiotapuensis]MDV3103944.1 hypothetical protein [Thermococcus waiotapuensis]
MRQKVYLALPFIIQPEVIILDEHTVYLDMFTRRKVWNAILELSKDFGTTILLATHNLHEAERLCDRILFFNKQKIAEGKPQELVEKVQALKAERKLIVKINGKGDVNEFRGVIQNIEVQSDGKFTCLRLYFRSDELQDIIRLLARYSVVDLQSVPVTLEEVFLQLCKK